MTPKKRIEMLESNILNAGIVIDCAEVVGEGRDGEQFVYVANPSEPDKPLLVMTTPVAAYALFAMSLAISQLTQGVENEVLHERLSLIKDLAREVAEILVEED